ncbi:hypothetical protein KDW_62830 [Dictyobacter vulcani]|uniref:Uncharacterized protein n=1 Tax=Dictyobacter vulcani TaxID=2607529 RepID=A0A5J4L041_9CHLR|nr:hypothetical protein [Dictyobacter vulcani]GER92121.1 hypothetical protein KDW_62830 [Dictyobacter vulcani]
MSLSEDIPLETSTESSPEEGKISAARSSQVLARRTLLTRSLALGTGIMGLNFLESHLPASAAAVSNWKPSSAIQHIAQNTTQLHSCGRATDGKLYHTIRLSSSAWQSSFGNINDQESNGRDLRFTDVDCSGVADNLHVATLAPDGVIWHTIRFASGSWQSAFGNVNNQESNGGSLRFSNVSCAGTMSSKLHLTALSRSGILWHTIRFANGSWAQAFGNVNNQESNGSILRFTNTDCAISGENLHVCAIDRNGTLWHTIRFADGSWARSFGNVNNQESNGSALRFTDVGCATIDGNLHVTAVAESGILWHTIRFTDGSWAPAFGNVNNQESTTSGLRFTDVDCANVANALHVTAINRVDNIWHTIRFANGSWQSVFGNVNHQESNGNTLRFTAVSAAGVV